VLNIVSYLRLLEEPFTFRFLLDCTEWPSMRPEPSLSVTPMAASS
jgi:hypothetical protein